MSNQPTILRATSEDAAVLQEIQRKAFYPDLQTYGDIESCPANESLESIIDKIHNTDYFKILIEGRVVGGFVIGHYEDYTYRLQRIFIDPKAQDLGIGSHVIKALDMMYPDAKKWALDTPYKNYRNHHFYEKFGFKKISEKRINDSLILFEYERIRA